MKAVGDRVVIERTITQKERKVIINEGDAKFDSQVVDKVIHIGDKVPKDWPIKIGEPVIVNVHARPEGMELMTDEKDKKNRVFHGIIHYEEVAGTYETDDKVPTKKSGAIINKA